MKRTILSTKQAPYSLQVQKLTQSNHLRKLCTYDYRLMELSTVDRQKSSRQPKTGAVYRQSVTLATDEWTSRMTSSIGRWQRSRADGVKTS